MAEIRCLIRTEVVLKFKVVTASDSARSLIRTEVVLKYAPKSVYIFPSF